MKSWAISQKYLDQISKTRLWACIISAVSVWGMMAYFTVAFSKVDLWRPLHARMPFVADFGILFQIVVATMPFWLWLFYAKIIRRARATVISLSETSGQKRIIKSVEGQSSFVSIDVLSEIRVLRGTDGNLTRIRLSTSGGDKLDVDGLDNFEDFLSSLKAAAPLCSVKEWVVPPIFKKLRWAGLALLIGLWAAASHGNISPNIFTGIMWILLLGGWFVGRSYLPVSSRWDENRISSQLGERYLWLDFIFAGVIFFLWSSAITLGMHAIQQGHPTDLLRLSFVPVVLGVLFLIPLFSHIRRMDSKRQASSIVILMAMLGVNVWLGITEHRRIVRAAVPREKWQDLMEQKHFAEAIPYLEEAYRKHSDDFRYAEPLAFGYSSVARYQDAINVLESLRKTQGKLSEYEKQLLAYAYLAPAYSYKAARNWPKMLEASKAAIQIKPDFAEAYHLAGLAAWEIQGPKSKEAHDYYARYLQLEPTTTQTAFIKKLYPDLFQNSK